jgi:hypothetical protein
MLHKMLYKHPSSLRKSEKKSTDEHLVRPAREETLLCLHSPLILQDQHLFAHQGHGMSRILQGMIDKMAIRIMRGEQRRCKRRNVPSSTGEQLNGF